MIGGIVTRPNAVSAIPPATSANVPIVFDAIVLYLSYALKMRGSIGFTIPLKPTCEAVANVYAACGAGSPVAVSEPVGN